MSLQNGYCGRLTTVGPDGYPYCVPLLYVLMDAQLFMHGTAARGHLRANAENNPKVCFESTHRTRYSTIRAFRM